MAQRTYAQIQDEIARLQREAEEAREVELAEVIDKINKAIEVYGLRPSDLSFPASSRGRASSGRSSSGAMSRARNSGSGKGTGAAKYKDDQGNTWVGRGPRPQWLRTALESGKSLDDFRV